MKYIAHYVWYIKVDSDYMIWIGYYNDNLHRIFFNTNIAMINHNFSNIIKEYIKGVYFTGLSMPIDCNKVDLIALMSLFVGDNMSLAIWFCMI